MKKILLALPLVLLLVSCGKVYRYTDNTFFAMNTVAQVIRNEQIKEDCTEAVVTDIEKRMSRTLSDSEISRVNSGQEVFLSEDTLKVLEKSLEIARDTDYAFNPCMGTLTDLWDITSGKNYVPTQEEIDEALSHCDASLVTIEDGKAVIPDGLKIDLGGVAKGYALERACEAMAETAMGYSASCDFCISLGGNVGVGGASASRKSDGKNGWNVGITNPFDKQKTMGTVVLEHGCVSVSGAYERNFEKDGKIYHHIFDGKTGYPSDSGLASAAVISDDGIEADALSTALFVMGRDKAVEFYKTGKYDFDFILISQDKEIYISRGIYDSFTVGEDFADAKITVITKQEDAQ